MLSLLLLLVLLQLLAHAQPRLFQSICDHVLKCASLHDFPLNTVDNVSHLTAAAVTAVATAATLVFTDNCTRFMLSHKRTQRSLLRMCTTSIT
jgi:hypothetical protein